jgi:O-antigen/teichoic acid export membrane protein
MKFQSTFVGKTAVYAVANFAVGGLPLLLLPVLTRHLSTEDYGAVAMFSVVTSFLFVVVGANAHGAIMVRFFDQKFDMPSYVTSVLAILLMSILIAVFGMMFLSRPLQSLTALPIKWLVIAVAVASCQFITQILLTLWQSSGKAVAYGTLRLSHALLDGLLSVLLVVGLLGTWEGRLTGLVAAWAAVTLFAVYKLRREGWIIKTFDRKSVADALRYGVPLVPHAVGGLMLGMADRLLVTNVMDLGSTGIYLAAVQIGMALGIAADAVNRAFAPWLMKKLPMASNSEAISIVRYTYLYFVVIIALAVFLSCISPYFIPILLGPEFLGAQHIVLFMFLGNAFMGMYYMVTNYVFFSRRTELLSMVTIVTGCVTIFLNFVLIKNFGLFGAAVSFMIGQGMLFLSTWCLAQYCHKMPWLDAFFAKSANTP